MTARRRDNRRFQAGSAMMGRQGATYPCRVCKRMTRETGHEESNVQLCAYCLLEAYLENELSDEVIEQPEFEKKLDELQKEYKRGKYAKNEADAKTRKIQSSKYVAHEDTTQEVLDVIATATDEQIVAAVDKVLAKVEGTAGLMRRAGIDVDAMLADKVSVKLGHGIVEVMQLDDASNVKDYSLEIDFSKKSFITLTGTRSALSYFADCCQNRVSSQYDQPLWYMSSADATAKKIRATLEGK